MNIYELEEALGGNKKEEPKINKVKETFPETFITLDPTFNFYPTQFPTYHYPQIPTTYQREYNVDPLYNQHQERRTGRTTQLILEGLSKITGNALQYDTIMFVAPTRAILDQISYQVDRIFEFIGIPRVIKNKIEYRLLNQDLYYNNGRTLILRDHTCNEM